MRQLYCFVEAKVGSFSFGIYVCLPLIHLDIPRNTLESASVVLSALGLLAVLRTCRKLHVLNSVVERGVVDMIYIQAFWNRSLVHFPDDYMNQGEFAVWPNLQVALAVGASGYLPREEVVEPSVTNAGCEVFPWADLPAQLPCVREVFEVLVPVHAGGKRRSPRVLITVSAATFPRGFTFWSLWSDNRRPVWQDEGMWFLRG